MQEIICFNAFYISILHSLRLQGEGIQPPSPPKSTTDTLAILALTGCATTVGWLFIIITCSFSGFTNSKPKNRFTLLCIRARNNNLKLVGHAFLKSRNIAIDYQWLLHWKYTVNMTQQIGFAWPNGKNWLENGQWPTAISSSVYTYEYSYKHCTDTQTHAQTHTHTEFMSLCSSS